MSWLMHDIAGAVSSLRIPAEDEAAFSIVAGRLDAGLIVLCDHAANALPSGYGTLGLAEADLERHIAYDIGAAGVARHVAEALGVPAVLTRYSRLLIDCNRGLDDPTLIMRLSDGAVIPANRTVGAGERARRIGEFYEPYHRAISRLIDLALAAGVPPALLSIHTYTETWRGASRPWHAAVLWDKDPRLARPLLSALAEDSALVVGDNQPYTGRLKGDCMWRHGTMRGLAHAIVEIRQDLVREEEAQRAWGDRLANLVTRVLARDDIKCDLNRVSHYGSHSA